MMLAGMLPSWQTGGAVPVQALPSTQRATVPVIIEVARGANPVGVARGLGVAPSHVYNEVFQGFAAELPAEAVRAINRRQGVLRVWPDLPVQAEAQELPTGVERINADQNPWADIDNGGDDINADVAVLDTGIAARPGELHIAGGKNCVNPGSDNYNDGNGHGTHVAGTIAAIDNNLDVVGVAPGARLWAVKVLDADGVGSISSVLCGLEWVSNNNEIDVVNMSLSAKASRKDQRPCTGNTSPLHMAICRVVNTDGIPVVVAAGNNGRSASRRAPATYEEVITVSAFKDLDGEPGKLEKSTACGSNDDTFAKFSNYGPDVDIAAPGVCILSTWPKALGDNFATLSGTSMATPHVTGAIALYIDKGPGPNTPDGVRTWLLTEASQPQEDPDFGFTGDPDVYPEPVLYLPPA
jgi:subtilisin family serine protease